jgi:hypothetical protein
MPKRQKRVRVSSVEILAGLREQITRLRAKLREKGQVNQFAPVERRVPPLELRLRELLASGRPLVEPPRTLLDDLTRKSRYYRPCNTT